MKRLLSPSTNLTGLISVAGLVYAAVVMVVNWRAHHGVFDAQVLDGAVTAVLAFAARQTVTPNADPKDLSGRPLVVAAPAEPPPAVTATVTAPPRQGAPF